MPAVRTAAALVTTATSVIGLGAPAHDAGAVVDDVEDLHCVVDIVGKDASGQYLTEAPVCYPTLAEALAESGPSVSDASSARSSSASSVMAFTLATHFINFNQGGGSLSYSGNACDGGYVNLPTGWEARLSSTANNCPNVIFFSGYSKGGASEATGPGLHNLGALNDASYSVSYNL